MRGEAAAADLAAVEAADSTSCASDPEGEESKYAVFPEPSPRSLAPCLLCLLLSREELRSLEPRRERSCELGWGLGVKGRERGLSG